MMYSDESVEKLRQCLNIKDYIKDRKCPKCGSENFKIDEKVQMYYCEDCKNGGNIFTYIMEKERKSFKDVCEEISKENGIELGPALINWGKLIENGKKCGIEYHFYDDAKLNACSCGGKARMYSKERKEKKCSFEHLEISCEECFKHISGVYDISGKSSDTYKAKDEVMENLINEWNGKNEENILKYRKNSGNGIFDRCSINGNYNWNMPGNKK